jgi:hypothetical protein
MLRFNRWSRRGIRKRIFDTLAAKSRDSFAESAAHKRSGR